MPVEDASHLERQEMLVVVKWLDNMAAEIRAGTATASSQPTHGSRDRDAEPVGPEAIKERFLAAIDEYTDLQIESICGMNHETVRQYRAGDWPERGPNRASTEKIQSMIARHEAILEETAIIARKKLPPHAAGFIRLAEFLQAQPDFVEEHPKLGGIYFADEMAREARALRELTIYDELVWLGYKIAHHFDRSTSSRVTREDVEFDPSEFFDSPDELEAGSDG